MIAPWWASIIDSSGLRVAGGRRLAQGSRRPEHEHADDHRDEDQHAPPEGDALSRRDGLGHGSGLLDARGHQFGLDRAPCGALIGRGRARGAPRVIPRLNALLIAADQPRLDVERPRDSDTHQDSAERDDVDAGVVPDLEDCELGGRSFDLALIGEGLCFHPTLLVPARLAELELGRGSGGSGLCRGCWPPGRRRRSRGTRLQRSVEAGGVDVGVELFGGEAGGHDAER